MRPINTIVQALAPPAPADAPALSAAARAASQALARNTVAVALSQPDLAVGRFPEGHEWLFARDGSLTARVDGAWLAGVSLPLRAARQQLKSMDARGPAACFLDPPHAAYLRAALDNLESHQAIIALLPGRADLATLLSCADFSDDIAGHRLWFVVGEEWATRLERLLADQPGLTTPSHFVRLPGADAGRLDAVISGAQAIFAQVTQRRSEHARTLCGQWRPVSRPTPRLAIACGRRFRLGDDAGVVLADLAEGTAGDLERSPIYVDDPRSAAMLALVESAVRCDAVLLPDAGRGDLPDLLPREMPWLTWVTSPRMPAFSAAGPKDRLLLADAGWVAAARAAGWPVDRVAVAEWPVPAAVPPAVMPPHVAAFADLLPLDPPEKLEEYSSQVLLWNALVEEISNQPFAVGADADAYLSSRIERFGIDSANLDRALFVRKLIEPAVARGIVRALRSAGVPMRVYGNGWAADDGGVGAIGSRPALLAAAAEACAVIDLRPAGWRNGYAALGRQLIPTAGRNLSAVARDIASAIRNPVAPPSDTPRLSAERVRSLLVG